MLKGEWTTSYGNKDHAQMIGEIIVDYFDQVGKMIIKHKAEHTKISFTEANPIYAQNMRDLGHVSTVVGGSFNCGISLAVAKGLFGDNVTSMTYGEYFDDIYHFLCEEFEGNWHYVPYGKVDPVPNILPEEESSKGNCFDEFK